MKKVQERTVTETQTVTISRIRWQPLVGLLAGIVLMSVVVLSGEELKHVPPAAPSYIVLHSFAGAPTDGAGPYAGLFRDGAGNLYGTTTYGGAESSACAGLHCGVVFKLGAAATGTLLHRFTGGTDGRNPVAGLIQDGAGNLYGTTIGGGAYDNGVVFKLSPTGTETVLYSFTGGKDGGAPEAGLIRDGAGNLYGTTTAGGPPSACTFGCGTVFRVSPAGTETVLYGFTGRDDGNGPFAGLVRDGAGNLYGTTFNGGPQQHGVVFKVSATGTETVLHSFIGEADGAFPRARLIQDVAGNLYGTTYQGGSSSTCSDPHGCGVAFKVSPSGTETVLHTFTGYPTSATDGAYPAAGLIQDAVGNLYGTTQGGGASGDGVVFELIRCSSSPSGYDFKVLYSFTGGADGTQPFAGLIQDPAGNLYGTVAGGGAYGYGVVFKLAP
jgi:uncharacterized repeat protein (TIGR03803 family)